MWLQSTGKYVHSQIILILLSFNLSQFVVWVLLRSVMPNRLSKILPYPRMVTSGLWVTTQLIWVSWGSEVLWLHRGSGMFERQQPSSAWKWPDLLYTISFVWPLLQDQQARLWEEAAPNRITWLRLLWVTGSLAQPEETVAVYCINKSTVYIRK